RGKLPEEEALSIFKDVLYGLNYAHSKGIIHRDVKPSNILVDKAGKAKIMDFGISIQTGQKRLTISGADVGTACYMSPEQITSHRSIDHRTDVYSMGIVLYELLVGEVPFDSDTDSRYEIQQKHCKFTVPDPSVVNPDIPEPLSEIILKALAKNPDDRFHGCGEFAQAVENYERSKHSTGTLIIESDPSDAECYLDGVHKGNTPFEVRSNKKQQYQLKVRKTGYQLVEQTVTITPGERTVFPVKLSKDKLENPTPKPLVPAWIIALIVLFVIGIVGGIYFLKGNGTPDTPEATGILVVKSEPSDAKCYLNEELVGTTPIEMNLKPGKYSLEVKKEGYKPYSEKSVIIEAGGQIVLPVTLTKDSDNVSAPDQEKPVEPEKVITTCALLVESTPAGASVYIDEQRKGITPYREDNLSPGSYWIKVQKDGYDDFERQVQVNPGKRAEVDVVLKKRPTTEATSVSELENFVQTYLNTINQCNVSKILSFYDDYVNYFDDGIVKKDFIRKDKENYCRRWPIVKNSLKGQIIVQNLSDESKKSVTFNIDFYVHNSERSVGISGTARNSLIIRKAKSELKIIEEKQKVLSRDKHHD
ncbi:MAG TPA: serine/threonine-protein kinase, partial [Thermodesulfovibrionia bacterium]|nr:serine/threonine-protein kinase [Thermodesulfovibrionia bacterium]